MKKPYLLVLTLASLLVVSCGEQVSSSSPEGSPSSESTTSEVVVSKEPDNFIPDGFKENLNGTYYSKEGTLVVGQDKVVLEGKDYYPTKYIVEDFNEMVGKESRSVEHAVTYLNASDGQYRIYYKGNDNRYQLALEKLEGEEYELVELFMPSIEEFTGIYSNYGQDDSYHGTEYNINFCFGNDFNFYRGVYDVGVYGMSIGLRHDTNYLKSFKSFINDELRTVVGYYDWADDYEYYTLVKEDDVNDGLYDSDYQYTSMYYDPLFLTFPYFANGNKTLQGTNLNVSEKKVTFGEIEYTYSFQASEKGEVVNLTSDSKNVKLSPTQYGMLWEENNVVTEYVYDSVSYVYGNYKYGDLSFELKNNENGEPVVLVNGEEAEFSYDIRNHKKAVKVNINNEDYYFTPFNQDIVILAETSKGQIFFVDETEYSEVYAKTFVNKEVGVYQELAVTEDFTVNYDGRLVKGNIFYDGKEKYPHLEFAIDSKEYKLSLLDLATDAAVLECGEEKTYFVSENVLSKYYDAFVSQSEDDLVVSKFKLSYFGEEYDYSVEPYYSDYYFKYFVNVNFETNDKKVNCSFENDMVTITETKNNGIKTTKTAITRDAFDSLVGTYYFNGEFGPEKLKLTDDGHFYADTVNETDDGLVYDVEYSYSLSTVLSNDLVTIKPIVTFYPVAGSKNGINCMKDGYKLMIGDVPYTVDYLFKCNGVYVDAGNANVVEVREDKVYVNGTLSTVKEVKCDEWGTYITVEKGFSEVTYTFSDYGDGVLYPSSNENGYTEYSKVELNYNALLGEYINGVTTYTLSRATLVSGKIEYGYKLSNGLLTVNEYSVVLKDGNIALKFALGGDSVYLYLVDGQKVIEVVSSIPLPPGPSLPPPPPPLI